MDATSYRQLRAYAAQYGGIIGLMWVVSFSFYIIGLTQPLIGNIGLLMGIMSVWAAGMLIRKFRREIVAIRYWHSWWMGVLIFMYAALLMAAAQFIYFRYIDNGLMIDTYATIMQQPEAVATIQAMMPGEDVTKMTEEVISLLKTISPIQLTFNFLTYNLFFGIFLAIPAAWIGRSGKTTVLPK